MAIGLPRIEPDGRPVGLAGVVDAVGILLRLQADGSLLRIGRPALARDRAIEIVAGVDLDAGLIREDFHTAATGRIP